MVAIFTHCVVVVTGTLDRYDIAANTWATVTYINSETFTTGSSAFNMGESLYIRKDATNRFFKYSVVDNAQRPLTTKPVPRRYSHSW